MAIKTRNYILALDQGTSSSRAVIFDQALNWVEMEQLETETNYPQSGWVEQDALKIWQNQLQAAKAVIQKAKLQPQQIAAIGITNQRETTVLWDKSGNPVYPAIIWQDKRTGSICSHMQKAGLKEYVKEKTGLLINPYFSATKIAWILDNVKGARAKAEKGELFFGNIDSWLVWNLTKGKLHITDYSNASRTMLYDINKLKWDKKILKFLRIPENILPKVQQSSMLYGKADPFFFGHPILLAGIAGDQQAALYGQQCLEPGTVKNTYGTGCFLLMNTGNKKINSKRELLTTIAWGLDDEITYALEGSIFMGGALIKWLRDDLKIISDVTETEGLSLSISDNGGIYFVPAFNGLGAPYWDTEARGIICGLHTGCSKAHIVRAALEALAFQTRDVITAMEKDSGITLQELSVDGGAAVNNFLLQFQADILGTKILRPKILESTALGAALLAAKATGIIGVDSVKKIKQIERIFDPVISVDTRIAYCRGWQNAIARTRLKDHP